MKQWHIWLCLAFVVLGVASVAVGADAVAFIPALGPAGRAPSRRQPSPQPTGHQR